MNRFDRANRLLSQDRGSRIDGSDLSFVPGVDTNAYARDEEYAWYDGHCNECKLPLYRDRDYESREKERYSLKDRRYTLLAYD